MMTDQECAQVLREHCHFFNGLVPVGKEAIERACVKLTEETVSKEAYDAEHFGRKDAEAKLFLLEQRFDEDTVSRKEVIDAVNSVLAPFIPMLHGCLEAIPLECARAVKLVKPILPKLKWTPVSEGYPGYEDEYKEFLVTDASGMIGVSRLYYTIAEPHKPYFSGSMKVVAWANAPHRYHSK